MTQLTTRLEELKEDWRADKEAGGLGGNDVFQLIEALEVAIRQRNIALHAAYMTGSEAFNTAKMNYDSEIEAILCEQGESDGDDETEG